MNVKVKKLVWSGVREPDKECMYHHIIGEAPCGGRYLVTWKGWKDYPSYVIDETPWGEWLDGGPTIEASVEIAQADFDRHIIVSVEDDTEHTNGK